MNEQWTDWERIYKNNSISSSLKKKYRAINLTVAVNNFLYNKTLNYGRKKSKPTEIERFSILIDWQNQYYENGYITKSNLHVQCNPHQNCNDIHHKD
jgi:hypothetical protein